MLLILTHTALTDLQRHWGSADYLNFNVTLTVGYEVNALQAIAENDYSESAHTRAAERQRKLAREYGAESYIEQNYSKAVSVSWQSDRETRRSRPSHPWYCPSLEQTRSLPDVLDVMGWFVKWMTKAGAEDCLVSPAAFLGALHNLYVAPHTRARRKSGVFVVPGRYVDGESVYVETGWPTCEPSSLWPPPAIQEVA